MKSLMSALLLAATSLPWNAGAANQIDIQRVLPNGQLSREIPAGDPVQLRISGIWYDSCTSSLQEFTANGKGRVLNLLHDRNTFILCRPVETAFTRDINTRFSESEIGRLSVTVLNTHGAVASQRFSDQFTLLQPIELAIQPPANRAVAVWPTAIRVPDGYYALAPLHNIGGGWYSPQHSGSGLTLNHEPRKSGDRGQDRLFGTWSNFATNGDPQWHLLADTYWATPTRLLGRIYRAEADPIACTLQFPNPECDFAARSAREGRIAGIFELQVHGPDELSLTIDDSGTTLLVGMVQPPVRGYTVRLRRL